MRRACGFAVLLATAVGAWLLLTKPGGRPDLDAAGRTGPGASGGETAAPGEGAIATAPGAPGPRLRGRAAEGAASEARAAERTRVLAGVLRRSDGGPVEGAEVQILGPRPGEDAARALVVAADGAFRFDGLLPGLHAVEAWLVLGPHAWYAESWMASGHEEHVLELRAGAGRLTVRVTDPAGEPVPAFQARCVDARAVGETCSGQQGLARVALGMAAATGGFVEVWGATTASGHGLPLAAARVGPLLGPARLVRVRLASAEPIAGRCLPATVAGRVHVVARLRLPPRPAPDPVLALLEPPADLRLAAPPTNDAGLRAFEGAFVYVGLDGAGRFVLPPLGEGALHELHFEVPDDIRRPAPRVARPGGAPLEVRLGTTYVQIVVRGPEERPVPARVEVRGRTPPPVPGDETTSDGLAGEPRHLLVTTDRADAAGNLRLGPLDPEAIYDLTVRPDSDSDGSLRAAVVQGWTPKDTVVRLERGLSLSGVVVDERGEPQHLLVRCVQDPVVPEQGSEARDRPQTRTEDDGSFRCEGLAPGPVRLQAREFTHDWRLYLETPDLGLVATVVAVAGESNVRIVVPRSLSVAIDLSAVVPDRNVLDLEDVFTSRLPLRLLTEVDGRWREAEREVVRPADRDRPASWEAIGLAPGQRYALWMRLPEDGRYIYEAFDASKPAVVPQPRPGATVRVRLPARGPRVLGRVLLTDALGRTLHSSEASDDGAVVVDGVPPGEWDVTAVLAPLGGDSASYEAHGRVAAGGELRLDRRADWHPAGPHHPNR